MKKALTVLLAIAMTLGVFALSGCATVNADDSYNYYADKYSELAGESDIRIDSITVSCIQMMCTTQNGKFLVYVDNEKGDDTGKRLQAINKLAQEWDVQIYHFNPDLGGGFAADDKRAQNIDISSALTGVVAGSEIAGIQKELVRMLHVDGDVVPNKTLFGIVGGSVSQTMPTGYYMKEYNLKADYVQKFPQYAAFLKENTLCIFNEDGENLTKKTLDSYFINGGTPAKRAMYAMYFDYMTMQIAEGLYTNNYACSVFRADSADYAAAIRPLAVKRPSYGQFIVDGVEGPGCYDTSGINTFNMFGDYRYHLYGDFDKGVNDYTSQKTDVYQVLANYGEFEWLMNNNDGHFAVFFGGPWCPNSQAVVKLTNDLAKDYGIKKIYVFDPRLDGNLDGTLLNAVGGWTDDKDNPNIAKGENGQPLTKTEGGKTYYAAFSSTPDSALFSGLTTRASDSSYLIHDIIDMSDAATVEEYTAKYYNANFLYGSFLDKYLPASDYQSQWNIGVELRMDRNDGNHTDGTAWETAYTKMSVPGIMTFDGSEKNTPAKLKGLAEAEYLWSQTSDENAPEHKAWKKAVSALFEENPYAIYNPQIEIPEQPEDDKNSGASGDGGNQTTGGNTTQKPEGVC